MSLWKLEYRWGTTIYLTFIFIQQQKFINTVDNLYKFQFVNIRRCDKEQNFPALFVEVPNMKFIECFIGILCKQIIFYNYNLQSYLVWLGC